jgi:hypothetical protein
LADIVETSLVTRMSTRPLLPSQRKRFREVQLPDGKYVVCLFVYLGNEGLCWNTCSSLGWLMWSWLAMHHLPAAKEKVFIEPEHNETVLVNHLL